ncbi:RDD family protein [Luteimonas aestuarii]|uniref:RDD family protein n=2 Tax=Luteimonas aestuarii TaxID=453837 RepID=A0A4R5TRF3_9GAMM|nr:RDD family protein [Luteimonas aestuarii]
MVGTGHTVDSRPRALVGWRMLSLLYDLLPVIALWFLVAVPFILLDAALHGDVRHNIAPYSVLWWMQWLACWGATGLYATLSWRRGGQTLGMRPWRLRVTDVVGETPAWRTLWMRYGIGCLSLVAAGAGFWWAWFDRDRLTWHDRYSGTRTLRMPKRGLRAADAGGDRVADD